MIASMLATNLDQPALLAVHTVNPPTEVSSIWMWVASAAMIAIMAMIAFKNAKRSHQD